MRGAVRTRGMDRETWLETGRPGWGRLERTLMGGQRDTDSRLETRGEGGPAEAPETQVRIWRETMREDEKGETQMWETQPERIGLRSEVP